MLDLIIQINCEFIENISSIFQYFAKDELQIL